jgi:hypothetical protein
MIVHVAFDVVQILLWAFAAARLTGLIALDELTAPLRHAAAAKFDPSSRWQRAGMYTIGGFDDTGHGCPWCVGVWVAAATAPAALGFWHIPAVQWVTATLAVAHLAGATWTWGR